jgi:hypothetical protein
MWGRCLVDPNLQLSGGVGVEWAQDFVAVARVGGGRAVRLATNLKLLCPCEMSEEHENTPDVINYIPKHSDRLQEQMCGAEIKYRCSIARFCFGILLLLSLWDFHNFVEPDGFITVFTRTSYLLLS